MFLLYALIAGLILGFLFGGRLSGLLEIRFRWSALMVAGLVVQIVLFSDAVAARVGALGPPIYVGSTAAVLIAVVRNFRVTGLPIVVLGAVSNLAAIVANGGFMPASPGALASLGISPGAIYSNSAVVPNPALWPLTDIFALPRWIPFANVFSVGDVLIGVGVAVTIVVAMRRQPNAGVGDATPDDATPAAAPALVHPDNSVERLV
jgi:hypothetical protein